jgi:segregation and condensation protein A
MSKVPVDKDQDRVPDPLTQLVENPDGTDPGSLLREEPGIPVPGETIPDGEGVVSDGPDQTGAMEDPVEILVGMAERGEIDPWNINIMEVTDRFLEELDRRRQLNLRISGRTLFFAATLLRMKSEHLEQISDEGDDDGYLGDDDDTLGDEDFTSEGRLGPIERLEREIQRRLDRKNMRKSPVTLFELIIELKNIEKAERRRQRLPPADSLLYDADDVVGIAHEEGYQESSMTTLMEFLEGIEPGGEMTLSELCTNLRWGIPEVYIPLLFLALDGRCVLRQEEFFGDIYVQICRAEGEGSIP